MKHARAYFLIILAVVAAPVLGGLLGNPGSDWYRTLVQPEFAPPGWVFGPVWTTLYALLAVSTVLVWRDAKRKERREIGWTFGVNIVLNALWSPVFFGAHRLGLSVFIILSLLTSTLYLALRYARVRPAYGWMNAPYLLWVGFATWLNVQIWMLN